MVEEFQLTFIQKQNYLQQKQFIQNFMLVENLVEIVDIKVSGGLHGVGASVVNALSNWTEVTIQRDGGVYQMTFERGKTVKPLTKIGDSQKNRN